MRRFTSIVALAAALLAGRAMAAEVPNLYGGQTIVTGMFEPERTRGLRQILLDVLVKVAAEPKLLDDPRVAPILERGRDFLTGFDYEDRMKNTPVRDEQGTRDRPYDLRMSFDRAKIDAALAGLGLQPWSSDRPAVLALVTVAYPSGSYLLTAAGEQGLGQRQALAAAAERRGLVVTLPASASAPAAAPTATDAVLKGTLRWQPDGAFWRTDWRLEAAQKSRSWSVDSPSFDEAFRNGVGEAAATLAGRR